MSTDVSAEVAIEMIGVGKSFGAFEALKDIHLKVMKGEQRRSHDKSCAVYTPE